MTRYFMVLVVLVMVGSAASALAHDQGSWEHKNHYLRAKVFELGGSPGCDLVANRCQHTQRAGRAVRAYFDTMRRMIAPPPVVATESTSPVSASSVPAQSSVGAGGGLASIRGCESGGDYSTNTGNGYYGAYQFDQQTWQAAGGTGMPHTAPPAEQDRVAANWIASGHRSAWPNC